ncbi:serine/threonine-protein kinase atr [Diaphorina citri]|uniref:Serine/threonine-protein kinase ATR n=1 Tax=Diaphorina citri TaxID=121845 RepID=A0A3Q0J0P4_DIACI|nr:serine/threonine-protein kinase atr [Diaphorina citri]
MQSGLCIVESHLIKKLKELEQSTESQQNEPLILHTSDNIWKKILDLCFQEVMDLNFLESLTLCMIRVHQSTPHLKLEFFTPAMLTKMYDHVIQSLKSLPNDEKLLRSCQRICCYLCMFQCSPNCFYICALPFLDLTLCTDVDIKAVQKLYANSLGNFKRDSLKYLALMCPYEVPDLVSCIGKIFNSVPISELIPYLPLIVYNSTKSANQTSREILNQQGKSSSQEGKKLNQQGNLSPQSQKMLSGLFDKLNCSSDNMSEKPHREYSRMFAKIICALQTNSAYCSWNSELKEFEIRCKICDNNETSDATSQLQVHHGTINPLDTVMRFMESKHVDIRYNGIQCIPTLYNHCSTRPCLDHMKTLICHLYTEPDRSILHSFRQHFDKFAFLGFKRELDRPNPEQYLRNSDKNTLKDMKQTFNEIMEQVNELCYQSLLDEKREHLQETIVDTLLVWGLVPLEFILLPIVKKLLLFISHPYSSGLCIVESHLIKQLKELEQSTESQQNKPLILHTSDNIWKKILDLCFQDVLDLNFLESLTLCMIRIPHFLNLNKIAMEKLSKKNHTFWSAACKVLSLKPNYQLTLAEQNSFKKLLNNVPTCHHMCIPSEPNEEPEYQGKFLKVYKPSSCQTQEGIAEFLSIRFLGILNQLESSLVRSDTPDDIKQNILLSLTYILPLLGPRYITPVRLKVLVTLRTALQLERSFFPLLVINVWNAFVRSVDAACLGPMLSTIFVSLLPLLSSYVHEVSDLFHYIIVTNEMMISAHIQELYFLPYTTEIASVHEIVQRYVKTMESMSLQSRLELLIKYVSHETIEVKLHALGRLHRELSTNHSEVRQLMLASDSVHSIVLQLLDVLILGFGERNEAIRLKCAECVGELGAVDPSHRPNKIIKSDLLKGTLLDIKSPEFVVQALTILCSGFQAARHSRTIDAFALAIQNMLSVYNVTPQASLWQRFPEHTQEVMKPLTTSRYTMDMNVPEPNVPHPIFGSVKGNTHEQWTYSWITRLIGFIGDESAKNIFNHNIPDQVPLEFILLPIVKKLLLFISHPYSAYSTLATAYLDLVATAHSLSLSALFVRYENILSQICADHVLLSVMHCKTAADKDVVEAFSFAFGYSKQSFLEEFLHKHLDVVEAFSFAFGYSKQSFLEEFLHKHLAKYLLPFAVENEAVLSCVTGLCEISGSSMSAMLQTGLNVKNLICQSYSSIIAYILTYYHKNKRTAQDAILVVKQYDMVYKPSSCQTQEGIAEFLSIRFLGILNQLESSLVRSDTPDDIKQNILLSLTYILPLLGPRYITPVRLKVLVTLRTALQLERSFFPLLVINVWNAFVRSVDAACLGPMLSTIFVSLLPLLSSYVHEVSDLFHYIIVTNEMMISAHIQELYFLPYTTEIASVHEIVQRYVKTMEMFAWGVGIGKATLHLRDRNLDLVKQEVSELRRLLTDSLFTSTGYREGYEYIVKLHMLSEFEKLATLTIESVSRDVLTPSQLSSEFSDLISNFDQRLMLMQPQGRVIEPVLCLRRVSLTVAQQLFADKACLSDLFNQAIGNCWLKSIEIARKASNFQQAYSNILAVDEKFRPKKLFIEKARLLWDKMEQVRALDTLTKGLDMHFPDMEQVKTACMEDRRTCAEAKLLVATYNDEMVNVDMDLNLKNYRYAVLIWNRWEKSIVYLAQYQVRALDTLTKGLDMHFPDMEQVKTACMEDRRTCAEAKLLVATYNDEMVNVDMDLNLKNYRYAVLIWNRWEKSIVYLAQYQLCFFLVQVTRTIENFISKLPTYMFFSAFSQIVSRICHPHDECFRLLRSIIVKCILEYPNHALWMFMSLHKSPYQLRLNRFNNVLKDARLKPAAEFIGKFQKLVEYLSHLCNMASPKTASTSLRSLNKALVRLLTEGAFSDIMIPIQRLRTLSLPSSLDQDRQHNPFSQDLVYFQGVEDHVHIFSSLKRPKMITFLGSDGNKYPMICKPKDDLRQDFRLMEFNSIVNMYLKRDPDARDRSLNIRTYVKVLYPLIDDCGLARDGTPHLTTTTSRPIMDSLCGYQQDKSEPIEKKRSMFLNHLVPAHPPVLRDWFLREFPSPSLWYLARTAYIRTCAVMSIVGYILGLGDRHGENILLDSTTGDLIHVDFNCLFNKGEQFDFPERVPFRLTHNMADAMGRGGGEGGFLYSCTITNRVLRLHKEQLLSVLKPFLYDPLVNWQGRGFKGNENAEMTNSEAKIFLENIEGRLQGELVVRDRFGQCSHLSKQVGHQLLLSRGILHQSNHLLYRRWALFMATERLKGKLISVR